MLSAVKSGDRIFSLRFGWSTVAFSSARGRRAVVTKEGYTLPVSGKFSGDKFPSIWPEGHADIPAYANELRTKTKLVRKERDVVIFLVVGKRGSILGRHDTQAAALASARKVEGRVVPMHGKDVWEEEVPVVDTAETQG